MKQNIETTCQDKNDAEFEKQVDEVCEQWKSFFREPYTGIDINGIAMPEVMRTAHTEGYDAFRRNMAVFYKLYGFNDHTSYGDYILSGRRGQDMINSANPVEWDRVIAAKNTTIYSVATTSVAKIISDIFSEYNQESASLSLIADEKLEKLRVDMGASARFLSRLPCLSKESRGS